MRSLATGLVVASLAIGCSSQHPAQSPAPQAARTAAASADRPQPQSSVWVCHGGRNPKWRRVSANAASAHRRHGDRVSETPQPQGQRCS